MLALEAASGSTYFSFAGVGHNNEADQERRHTAFDGLLRATQSGGIFEESPGNEISAYPTARCQFAGTTQLLLAGHS